MPTEHNINLVMLLKGNTIPLLSGLMLMWNSFIAALPTIILLLTFLGLVVKISYDVWRWWQHYKEIKHAIKERQESKDHQREHQD